MDTPVEMNRRIIGIKGAGEMASGVAWRLFQSGFRQIFMMETAAPLAVRLKVSFCEAVYDNEMTVEGVTARKATGPDECRPIWNGGHIPVLIDPEWTSIGVLQPHVVIDAILAKKNLGTALSEAPLVIGLGPGFNAGTTVHMAIETNRGHDLGRVILDGFPEPNTGIPGNINGHTADRVLRAPCTGMFTSPVCIGTQVQKTDVVAHVDRTPVIATIDGVIRGLIRNNTPVTANLKIGDIDPRGNTAYCTTISEKARAIGGSVLEAILRRYNQ